MASNLREMRVEDARKFLEVHHAAVRGIAAKDYPREIIDDWAPMPVTDQSVERFLKNPEVEIRLVAELSTNIVGIGALVTAKRELRACYVSPQAARQGVGSALVLAIERIARDHGLSDLRLDSSITAEPFYLSLGYVVDQRCEHIRSSGLRMACVKMSKVIA